MSDEQQQQVVERGEGLLEGLTEPQRRAVEHVDGPLLVLAGAGSGKTRVITRRIAHLVLRVGIPPWNVLAITFTNKAAGEMRERIARLMTRRQAEAVTACTFHSLCTRILRRYAERVGLPSGFTIYDTADQQRVVKQALEGLEISTGNFPPAKVLSAISHAKNDLIGHEAYAAGAGDFYSKNVARVYGKYQEILKKNQALDFDDLLMVTTELLKKDEQALGEVRQKYRYLLIDEYQDTNHAQFLIAHGLASGGSGRQNICATGDPDQSIYGWRGANIHNILEFESRYPEATVIRLEQNYRSTVNILAVADKLIQNNRQRKHKKLWTENEVGERVRVATLRDERHEAGWVVERLKGMREEKGLAWGEMAVFYRINSLSRVMEDALRTAGVPYQIARGTAFFDRKEIKDAVGYLRVIANPADEVNLLRIINMPARGISEGTVEGLTAEAVRNGLPVLEWLGRPGATGGLSTRAAAAVQRFAKLHEGWRAMAGYEGAGAAARGSEGGENGGGEKTLRDFVDLVIRESGLHGFHGRDKSDPDQERLANLGELVSSAQQFEEEYGARTMDEPGAGVLARKLEAYLEQISLVSDVDGVNSAQGSVTLMTLHAAKGLEFPVVAMIGVEDGLLPHDRANTNPSELEEERRLCFVGITRAKRFLMMTHARSRTVFGQTTPTIPSRFFKEFAAESVEKMDLTMEGFGDEEEEITGTGFGASRGTGGGSPKREDGLAAGALVRHPVFGLGRVMHIGPVGRQTRAQVQFNTAGVKTLILEYANLERV